MKSFMLAALLFCALQPATSLADDSCSTFPEQAQVIASVESAKPLNQNGAGLCEVRLVLTSVSQHSLCPLGMAHVGRRVTVQMPARPDGCAQTGDIVSGVLRRDYKDGLSFDE